MHIEINMCIGIWCIDDVGLTDRYTVDQVKPAIHGGTHSLERMFCDLDVTIVLFFNGNSVCCTHYNSTSHTSQEVVSIYLRSEGKDNVIVLTDVYPP